MWTSDGPGEGHIHDAILRKSAVLWSLHVRSGNAAQKLLCDPAPTTVGLDFPPHAIRQNRRTAGDLRARAVVQTLQDARFWVGRNARGSANVQTIRPRANDLDEISRVKRGRRCRGN